VKHGLVQPASAPDASQKAAQRWCTGTLEGDKMIPIYEQRLDELFCDVFEPNHPAMHDWVRIKMELKQLRLLQTSNKALKQTEGLQDSPPAA